MWPGDEPRIDGVWGIVARSRDTTTGTQNDVARSVAGIMVRWLGYEVIR